MSDREVNRSSPEANGSRHRPRLDRNPSPSGDDDAGLPENWTRVLSNTTKTHFYHNRITGETSWDRPKADSDKGGANKVDVDRSADRRTDLNQSSDRGRRDRGRDRSPPRGADLQGRGGSAVPAQAIRPPVVSSRDSLLSRISARGPPSSTDMRGSPEKGNETPPGGTTGPAPAATASDPPRAEESRVHPERRAPLPAQSQIVPNSRSSRRDRDRNSSTLSASTPAVPARLLSVYRTHLTGLILGYA